MKMGNNALSAFNREPYISEYEGVLGGAEAVSRYSSAEGRQVEFRSIYRDGRIASSVYALTKAYVFVLCVVFVQKTDSLPAA